MNIAELAIRKSTITWTLSILLLVVGYKSFNSLPRLEDPEFTIKDAIISTPYPGASAKEVEEEVSDVIERAVQELGQLKRVQSTNTRGMSSVKATIKDQYDAAALPQVWDELRRKVNDYQSRLPPGAGPSIVNDDFGDVYGVYAVLTGEGYTMAELYEYEAPPAGAPARTGRQAGHPVGECSRDDLHRDVAGQDGRAPDLAG
jgi:multidrug efflux pump subunit AcrB